MHDRPAAQFSTQNRSNGGIVQQKQGRKQGRNRKQEKGANARAIEDGASISAASTALNPVETNIPASITRAPAEAHAPTSAKHERMTAGQVALAGLGFLAFGIGVAGIFVPLLPTTPLVMLAAFLLAKSSPRLHARILQTKTYRTYVLPFKEKGGMPRATKIRALAISLGVLAISAAIVRIWYVWMVLGIIAAAISYTLIVRVPTQKNEQTERAAERESEPAQ